MTSEIFLQVILNGASIGLIYALIALGLTIALGIMHIVNFAHGEVYMLGGFAVFFLNVAWGLNYWLAVIVAMLLTGVVGVGIERSVLRRVRGLFMESMVVTFGLSMFLQNFAAVVFGKWDRGVTASVTGSTKVFGATLANERLVLVPISLVLLVGFALFVKWTRLGRAMRASYDDVEMASLTGVSVDRIHMLCMGIGGALAGAAGALLAPVFFVSPYAGGAPMLKAFIVIIVGGLGSIPGSIAAGLLLGLLEAVGGTYLGQSTAVIISFAALIVFLVIRPRGFFGHA